MNETDGDKKRIIVGLFSPYLYENMSERFDSKYITMQKEKFGYESENLNGTKTLSTDKFIVRLDRQGDHESRGPDDLTLGIIGSTDAAEDDVRSWKGSGLVVARFSIFYGNPSQYTGNYPEESGYSLDFPKDIATVREFLHDDSVLDALVAREESQIRSAIESFNSGVANPVLVTDYLHYALRCRK
ncbi:hypothetical protein HN587_07430 [Candidatus Woesearchaeota archaeon]|jgi:hypothetical protein|nr:hypothetical protein [Candidatus Woesearchaeota archaeon]